MTKIDKPKLSRMRRILASIVELTSAMAADWVVEYPRYAAGQLKDDPNAFVSLAVMRHKMVKMGGDAEMLLQTVATMDRKFAEAQYAKLLKARDSVMTHDEHFKAESAKFQAAQTQAQATETH